MNKVWILLLLTGGTLWGQTSYTLNKAIEYATTNHLKLKNGELDITKAEELKKEYRAIGLPQVNMTGSFNNFLNLPVQVVSAKFFNPMAGDDELVSFRAGTNFSGNGTLQVSQLIFNGSYFIGVEAAKQMIDLQKTLLVQTQEEVVFNVMNAYHLAAVSKENKRFSDSMVVVTEQLVKKQKNFFDLGMITQEDVDQVNYALLSAKNVAMSAQIQLDNSIALLKMAMFYPLDQPLEVEEGVETLLARATLSQTGNIGNNLNLKLLNQQVDLDELNIKNKKFAFYPTLSGYFQQAYNAYRNDFDFFGKKPWFSQTNWGLQLNVPIFSSGQRYAQLQQTKIQLMKDENMVKITENALKMQEIQAQNNLNGAKQKMDLQKENIRLAGVIYNNAVLKEQIGKGNSIDATQKYNQLMIAQAQYVGSLVEVFQAKLNLDKLYNQILK